MLTWSPDAGRPAKPLSPPGVQASQGTAHRPQQSLREMSCLCELWRGPGYSLPGAGPGAAARASAVAAAPAPRLALADPPPQQDEAVGPGDPQEPQVGR